MMVDTGTGPDTGIVPDSSMPDTSGSSTTRTLRARFLDADDGPVAGVHVAIDTDLGRVEGQSDAAGEVTIDYRYMVDSTDFVAALEGYRIVAVTDAGYMEPEAADGFAEMAMIELDADLGAAINVRVGATGVPTGGRYCVGLVAHYVACQDEGAVWSQSLREGTIADIVADYVYGYAFDDAGALYDFAPADWSVNVDGDRSATLAFDGTFDETPMERDITINLPTDPESPFRTEMLDETWQGWVAAVEPTTHLARSALTMVSIGTDTVTARVHFFPVAGDELVWATGAYANIGDFARSFVWYSGDLPAGAIEVLDLPRVRSGSTWTDEFEWTAPASDVDSYGVTYTNNAGVVVIQLRTTATFGAVPALPSAYDETVAFPFPGAPGELQVLAIRGDVPPDDMATDPYRVDGEASWSLRHPFVF
jgi:hypothetical protein